MTNIFTIFSFASGAQELKKIEQNLLQNYVPASQKAETFYFKMGVIDSVLIAFGYALSIIYLLYLRYTGHVSVGEIVIGISMTFVVLERIGTVLQEFGSLMRNLGELRSSFEIIATPNEPDINEGKDMMIKNPSIAFENISFKYQEGPVPNDKLVFDHLDLNIKAGEKVGLVGISGAGKSTLVSLLLRYFDVNSGNILIDGQDTAQFSKNSVRKNIGLIPQDVLLFHRSIFENIAYSKEDASLEEVIAAAKIAKIHEFIETLPDKYQILVGERGIKLSGGQRQRIAIARAILKNAPILILDEATSSLDTQTEIEIQESIDEIFKNINATVIAIAHRLSTLRNMDRIIVLDGGKILEEGRHEELVAREGSFYKKLWEMGKI